MYSFKLSVLLVTDISGLRGIEEEVADGGNQTVDAEGDCGQQDVSTGSAGETLGLQGSVVDDQAADPTQEEGEQKTSKVLIYFWFSSL